MHLPQVALQVAITNMLYKYGSLPLWTMRKRTVVKPWTTAGG
jgi:hypothetical protein